MFRELLYTNYASCSIVFFMVLFLFTNNILDKKVSRLFVRALLYVIVLVAADSIEEWTAGLTYFSNLRIWMSAIGYTLRPCCILCVLQIITRHDRLKCFLLELPAILNGLIAFSALFSSAAFSYTPDNQFVRGPLGSVTYVVCALYLVLLLVVSARNLKEKNYYEGLIVIAIVLAAVVSVVLEVSCHFSGLINTTIAISLTFYYLYFHTQTVKRDQLTNVLNRRCFYLSAERDKEQITALIAIDLNYLKQINDTQGHDAGDEAIRTLAECIQKQLPRECHLYRVGGDEFSVICLNMTRVQLEWVIEKLRSEIRQTKYSCAIGLAMANGSTDFDALCARADKAMYQDKQKIKKELQQEG